MATTMSFDEACEVFTDKCLDGAIWKDMYLGAAYMTRIKEAYAEITRAYNAVVEANNKELNK